MVDNIVSPSIPDMYAEWLAVRSRPRDGKTDEEMDVGFSRYQELQAAIIAAEPQTPRDVAIMFMVDTDFTDSIWSDDFEARIRALADVPPADPLQKAIEAYRAGLKRLNDLEISEDITLAEENALFEAAYGKEKAVLMEAAPAATSLAGVREAIRLVFDEDAIDDMVAEGALRAALAYLDGRA